MRLPVAEFGSGPGLFALGGGEPEVAGRSPTPLRNGGTGILPYQSLRQMAKDKVIDAYGGLSPEQFQPASIDLRLGNVAWRVSASFLPGAQSTVMERVRQLDGHEVSLKDGILFERGAVYVVKLQEHVALTEQLSGIANPKSSTGRLDVLVRLITDRGTAFDEIRAGYKGPLYAEIAPRTFAVIVREGDCLNQARFQRGMSTTPTSELQRLFDDGQLIYVPGDFPSIKIRNGLVPVSIDLKGKTPDSIIGYRAKRNTSRVGVDLQKRGFYDPTEFWEPIKRRSDDSLILDRDEFYILMTQEEVGVPPDYAAEMVPHYTRSGEYRVHYAGFFDPGFGYDRAAQKARGSKAVLEVRSYEVPVILEHGQTVGWLRYDRMRDRPDELYGSDLKSNYQGQGLALSKHFKSWPTS
jgi:dCTP deaminase